jgi:phosphatidylethanolamine/phosphatidyl-N-methylethanolamine N-methyltransferase
LRLQSNQGERQERSRRQRPLSRFADEARFFKAWVEKPLQTGAVSPSGRFLARMMARYADPAARGPVVELGPGTGPVTQALIKRGIAAERLILVEYDPEFCRLLARRFPRARIVQGDAYDLPRTLAGVLTEPAACIVSSLPLLMKPDPQRLALLRDAFAMMAPGGRFVQFTYGMLSPIPRRGKDGLDVPFIAEASPAVWLNLPPARVFAYQAASEASVRKLRPGQALIGKVKEGADRMRDELRERTDRVQSEIRLVTARAREDFVIRHRVGKDGKIRPAFGLLAKIGDGKRAPKR